MTITESSIYIRNLRLYAFHGVMLQEREVGGWFILSLRVHYNYMRALETDDVNDTVNYADLCELVRREMEVPSKLLEHVAGRIIRQIQHYYPEVERVELELAKENPPMGVNSQGAGIRLCASSAV